MITYHTCLTGGRQSGDAVDCPACRAMLLESFRPPVGEEPVGLLDVPPPQFAAAERMRPHLIVPSNRMYTVPIGPVEHTVDYGVDVHTLDPRRLLWWARCSCGWSAQADVVYDATVEGPESAARQTARDQAYAHQVRPDDTHVTTVVSGWNPATGGSWLARCDCGWTRSGRFAKEESAREAHRIGDSWAKRHQRYPDEPTEGDEQ